MSQTIRPYTPDDSDKLFALLEREGEEWQAYWRGDNRAKYEKVIAECSVFGGFVGDELVGYVRVRDDGTGSMFIMDLLVDKSHRLTGYGKALMAHVKAVFSDNDVYVLGATEVYDFYEKCGYTEEGKVYKI